MIITEEAAETYIQSIFRKIITDVIYINSDPMQRDTCQNR